MGHPHRLGGERGHVNDLQERAVGNAISFAVVRLRLAGSWKIGTVRAAE